MKELGERWSKVTAEVKQMYELQAGKDKKRYEIEMENYRNKKSKREQMELYFDDFVHVKIEKTEN
jgi:hypothetical protein